MIQAVAIPIIDGLRIPNQYNELPLIDMDPTKLNPAFFAVIDSVVVWTKNRNMILALLPTWGDKLTMEYGGDAPIIFNKENAYQYGMQLGARYKSYDNLVWVLGGDHPAYNDKNDWRPVWSAIADGIKKGSQKECLFSFHPGGKIWESSLQVHNEDWLDFNMIQSGHSEVYQPVWKNVNRDWNLKPTKPVLDAEPCYEDHPIHPWPTWDPANGYFREYQVRKQLYRSVFAGGAGVTYGHHSVWQFYSPKFKKLNYADRYWQEAMNRPSAIQAGYLRKLMESRPYNNRIPDQSIILNGQGEKGEYICAFRDDVANYLMVYLPVGKEIEIKSDILKSNRLKISWFDPRTGNIISRKNIVNTSRIKFTPPTLGIENDWVLIIDGMK